MKRSLKILFLSPFLLLIIAIITSSTYAHSGRTDSRGGHKDNKNKSGLGSYHYHCGGYPAHLHTNGYCPYRHVFPNKVVISLDKTTLRIGETISFSTEVLPENACNTKVSISCDNDQVIQVYKDTIEAIGYGTAVITCKSFNEKTATVTITVEEIVPEQIEITSESDLKDSFYIGDSITYSAILTPTDVDNPTVTWKSSNPNVASTDDNGHVTTHNEGSATITASTFNGKTHSLDIQVEEQKVHSINLSKHELVLHPSENYSLSHTVTPTNATFPNVTWTSSNSTIAKVDDNGKIVAVSCGTTTITATTKNGVSDSAEITVREVIAEKLEILGSTTYNVNDRQKLMANIYPSNTTDQEITWNSNKPSIVDIDENGNIICLSEGTAIITATQRNTSTTTLITVNAINVNNIVIQSTLPQGKKLRVNETLKLSATVSPQDATYPDVTWISNTPTVAKIDSTGIVTAIAPGKAIITATTIDGCVEEYAFNVSHSSSSFFKTIFKKHR